MAASSPGMAERSHFFALLMRFLLHSWDVTITVKATRFKQFFMCTDTGIPPFIQNE